jgi:hypothetical protein
MVRAVLSCRIRSIECDGALSDPVMTAAARLKILRANGRLS